VEQVESVFLSHPELSSSSHPSHYSDFPDLESHNSFPGPAQQQSTQAPGPPFIHPSQPRAPLPYQSSPSTSESLCSRSEPSRASRQRGPYARPTHVRLGTSTSSLNQSFSFLNNSDNCDPSSSRAEQVDSENRDDENENEAATDDIGPSLQDKAKKTKPRDPRKDLSWWKKNSTPQRYNLVKLMHSLLGFYLRQYFFPIFHPPGQPKSGAFPHTGLIEEARYIYGRLNLDCPKAEIPSAFFSILLARFDAHFLDSG